MKNTNKKKEKDEKEQPAKPSKVITLAEFDRMMKGLMKVKPPQKEG